MKLNVSIFFLMAMSMFFGKLGAQETPTEDTLAKTVKQIQSDLKSLKKLKFSGYLQAQLQFADSNGIASYAGGNFNANTDKRFSVRRGRLKATYTGNLSLFVIQVDVTEKGVGIKDAYAKFTEPWLKAFTVTGGVFDRPFGFEIGYSSSSRETPERGRMSQIIFPGERELGMMLTFQMPKGNPLNFLKVDAGMFNGSGPTAVDFDYQKDFIGRIRADRTTKSEKISYGLGVSYYDGGWRQGRKNVYTMGSDSAGLSSFELDNDTANYGQIAKRTYMGADFQFSIDWPIGITTLRAEYITGQQPGSSSNTASVSVQPSGSTYLRNFNGMYLYFIQDIWKTKHQLVVKYDWYDPNLDVAGDDIGKSVTAGAFGKTTSADLKYTTIGLGWNYRWDNNVKLMFYYDMVTNETSKNLSGWTKDRNDNVFTFRIQYKF